MTALLRPHRAVLLPLNGPIGDFLYGVGFLVEYQAIRALRGLRAALRFAGGSLGGLAVLLLRPLVRQSLALADGFAHLTPRRALQAAAPVLAAAGLALLVRTTLRQPFVLEVQVEGQVVGCVASEQVFDAAKDDVQRRIASAGLAARWQLWPTYTLTVSDKTMTESAIANAILQASADTICDATAVYVDGELRFVTDEGDHLRSFLASLQTPWIQALEPGGRVEFVHNIRLTDGVYLPQSVVGLETVLADRSLFTVKTVVQRTRQTEIPFETVTFDSPEVDFGKSVIVQEGVPGVQELTEEYTYIEGELTDVTVVDTRTVTAPVARQVAQGVRLQTGMLAQTEDGSFLWPVPDYRGVSRWMSAGHQGADIYAPYGTPIYASAGGTVTTAGWHNSPYSYGNYVVIDHGNGWTTLYGHMSSYVVAQGDSVAQGQLIGYMGSTGYSFGNHCHFEMTRNGVLFDAHALFPGR